MGYDETAAYIGAFVFAILAWVYVERLDRKSVRRFWVMLLVFCLSLTGGMGLAAGSVGPAAFTPPMGPFPPSVEVYTGSGVTDLQILSYVSRAAHDPTDAGFLSSSFNFYRLIGKHHVKIGLSGSPNTEIDYVINLGSGGYETPASTTSQIVRTDLEAEPPTLGTWGKMGEQKDCPEYRNSDGSPVSAVFMNSGIAFRGSIRLDNFGHAKIVVNGTEDQVYYSESMTRTVVMPARLLALVESDSKWCVHGQGFMEGTWVAPQKTTFAVNDPMAGLYGQDPKYEIQRSHAELYTGVGPNAYWQMPLTREPATIDDQIENRDSSSRGVTTFTPHLIAIDPANTGRIAAAGFFAAVLLGFALGCLLDLAIHWPSHADRSTASKPRKQQFSVAGYQRSLSYRRHRIFQRRRSQNT